MESVIIQLLIMILMLIKIQTIALFENLKVEKKEQHKPNKNLIVVGM